MLFLRQEEAMRLSGAQRQVAAEILGNTAVAWFSAGVIFPLFSGQTDLLIAARYLAAGLTVALLLAMAALFVVKRTRRK